MFSVNLNGNIKRVFVTDLFGVYINNNNPKIILNKIIEVAEKNKTDYLEFKIVHMILIRLDDYEIKSFYKEEKKDILNELINCNEYLILAIHIQFIISYDNKHKYPTVYKPDKVIQ